MKKDNTTIPPCTPPQALYLHGQINDDPYFIAEYDVDCKWHPQPLIGFEKHRDSDTGAELPNCCEHHKKIANQAAEWFSIFPNCCDHHKSLAEAGNLKKEQYKFIPDRIVLLVAQTEHVIEESINKPNWEKAITGYIDYCFVSFGLYAVGLNIYLDSIKRYVACSEDMPEKTQIITDYIIYVGANYKFDVLSTEFFDYDDHIVQDWLQLFPFDLEMFKNHSLLSQYFTVPLPYDITKKRFQFDSIIYSLSERNLIEFFNAKTLELISRINASNLFQKGVLTDPDRVKMELLLSERTLQIEKMNRRDDRHYNESVDILQQWFKEEVDFLDQIAPLIKEREDLLPKKKPIPDLLVKHYAALKEQGINITQDHLNSEPKSTTSTKQENHKRTLTFSSPDVQEKVFELLKGYFPGKEEELKMALNGEHLTEKLLFPHNQNKLVEVFKRLKYNGYIVDSKYQINRWLRKNFKYQFELGKTREIRNLSKTTIKQLLSSGKGEPTKEQRICSDGDDWLPYKNQVTLDREKRNEKI